MPNGACRMDTEAGPEAPVPADKAPISEIGPAPATRRRDAVIYECAARRGNGGIMEFDYRAAGAAIARELFEIPGASGDFSAFFS